MKYNNRVLRHELKFYINYTEYHYLVARIKNLMKMDENSSPGVGYHIRSLYFDDMYHTALKEKESGILFRQKYRIRIYDKQDKVIKLECKEKFGEYISKASASLNKQQFYEIINGGDTSFMLNEKSKLVLKDTYIKMRTKLLRPAVIVDYRREVFVLEEGNVRITFDRDLQAGINTPDIFSDNIVLVNALPADVLVLEVKFDDYLPLYVKKLIQIANHNRSAISKYVLCRLLQLDRNPCSHIITNYPQPMEMKGMTV